MAMALHPDKLKLAHEELDRVVGVDRLPTISDRGRLPYVNAIIKETMRWHPALPLSEVHPRGVVDFLLTTSTGIARCTSEDDLYEGYDIPKGTIVMPNVWYVLVLNASGALDSHSRTCRPGQSPSRSVGRMTLTHLSPNASSIATQITFP